MGRTLVKKYDGVSRNYVGYSIHHCGIFYGSSHCIHHADRKSIEGKPDTTCPIRRTSVGKTVHGLDQLCTCCRRTAKKPRREKCIPSSDEGDCTWDTGTTSTVHENQETSGRWYGGNA